MSIAHIDDLKRILEAPLPYWKSDVPEGRSGDWIVERFELPPIDLAQVDLSISPDIPEWALHRDGTYTKLAHGSTDFMSDLYEEWWSQRVAVEEGMARGGQILISGLGLGMIVECLLRPEDSPVERVTVIEKSKDVIALVADHMDERYGGRLRIINADVFDWDPEHGQRFTVGWHDIWPNPDENYRHEMVQLRDKFAPHCDWQGFWSRDSYHQDSQKACLS